MSKRSRDIIEKNYVDWTALGSIQDSNDDTTSITGSSHLLDINVENDLYRLMVDCGAYNGTPIVCDKNNTLPNDPNTGQPLNPSSIDSVILTHTHNDHVGRIPKIVGNGYPGNIHLTTHAHHVIQPILEDSLFVNTMEVEKTNEIVEGKKKKLGQKLNRLLVNRDIENTLLKEYSIKKNSDISHALKRKFGSPLESIFTAEDLKLTLPRLRSHDYFCGGKKQIFDVFDTSEFIKGRFLDAGHIFGSAITLLSINKPGKQKAFNILWGGDMGRLQNRIYGEGPDLHYIKKPIDLLFTESTYGGRIHPDINKEIDKLEDSINVTFKKGGQVLIPCFTQTRQQEMLRYLCDSINSDHPLSLPKDTEIIFDSPLGEKIMKQMAICDPCYGDLLYSNNDNIIRSEGKDTEQLLLQKRPNRIFLTSGGMLQGGTSNKIIHYFDKNRKEEKRANGSSLNMHRDISKKGLVVISGFTPSYTLGHKVANDPSSYNCLQLKLSSHGDHYDIIDFITNKDNCSGVCLRDNAKICTMHGSLDGMYAIKRGLEDAGIKPENIIVPSAVGKKFRFKI